MDIGILFGTFLILVLIGFPIGYTIGIATTLTLVLASDIPLSLITQNAYAGVDSYPLLAIPFFILAGTLMTHGGIAKQLLRFMNVFVGRFTGGLGMCSTVTCMFFGAISGSALATCSAIGSFMIPSMKEHKYDGAFSASLVAAAGTIGIIIPPSIPFVVYGVVTGTSIGELFIAGIIPGIMMAIALCIACYIISKKNGYKGDGEKFSFGLLGRTSRAAIWALLCPIIVLGGIYGGVFTPTEAAAVSVVYALFIGFFVYKELNFKNCYQAFVETVIINGITSFMIGLSMAFATFLTLNQIPQRITEILLSITDSRILIFLLINLFLLVVGCLIDNVPACIILAPILLPVVKTLGMDPIQFGVVLTLNLAIGFVTPPYGPNLFVAASISHESMNRIFVKVIPFIFSLFIVLMIVTYTEWPTMFLVDMMKK